jgi:hypothetical protein
VQEPASIIFVANLSPEGIEMSKIIKILVAVDAESILRDHTPNGSQPVPLKNEGKGYAFLMTDWADTDEYQYTSTYSYAGAILQDQEEGGYALNVRAEVDDVIEWRAVTLTSPFHYRCYLSGLQCVGGWYNVTQPIPKIRSVACATITPGSKRLDIVNAQVYDYWWESTVKNTNRQAYNVLYNIVDGTGANRGVFTHDPYIT